MASTKKTRLTARRAAQKAAAARRGSMMTKGMFSAGDCLVGDTLLSPRELCERECPSGVKQSLVTAREYDLNNGFVNTILLLKTAFLMFGMRFAPRDASKKEAFSDWLAKHNEKIEEYAVSVGTEWLGVDNVVSFYRRDRAGKTLVGAPFLLRPEKCTYTDVMGIPVLTTELSYTAKQLEDAGFTGRAVSRYSGGILTLKESEGEYFKVMTRNGRGGFAHPRLRRVFRVLSQNESMEFGESWLAYGGRRVVHWQSFGWEIKSGTNMHMQDKYLWKKERADGVKKELKNKQGLVETTRNFDHKSGFDWVDPKFYDSKKWETIINRLLWWAGPIGFMMVARSVQPFYLPILKVELAEERRKIKRHIESVLNEAYAPPGGLALHFSNKCFIDSRLAWDMTKALMVQGPLSLTTALESADEDPATEAARKLEEAKPENGKKLLPLFDPNHSKTGKPGQEDKRGRKPGEPDDKNQPS